MEEGENKQKTWHSFYSTASSIIWMQSNDGKYVELVEKEKKVHTVLSAHLM